MKKDRIPPGTASQHCDQKYLAKPPVVMLQQLDSSRSVSIDFSSWLGALSFINYQPIETDSKQSNCLIDYNRARVAR